MKNHPHYHRFFKVFKNAALWLNSTMWKFLTLKWRHFEYFLYFRSKIHFICLLLYLLLLTAAKILKKYCTVSYFLNLTETVEVLNYIYIINCGVIYFRPVVHAQLASFHPKNRFFLFQQYFSLRFFLLQQNFQHSGIIFWQK